MDNAQAMKELGALLKVGGALRIITSEHACGSPTPATAAELKRCDAYEHPRTHPAHFVIHDVVRLEALHNGQVRAWSEEGDYTDGEPSPLLRRLQEAGAAKELPEPLVLGDPGFEGPEE